MRDRTDVAKEMSEPNGKQGSLEDQATLVEIIQTSSYSAEPLEFPYKGLNPYTEADTSIFFGREKDILNIVNNLLAWRLTILYGKSGVGKSSVLRAGVIHSLNEEARQNVADYGVPKLAVVVFPPLESGLSWKDDPLAGIMQQINATIAQSGWDIPRPESGLSFIDTLRGWTTVLGGEEGGGALYLILDQFEEYALYHAKESGEGTFYTEFPRAINASDLRVNFLISIRDDSITDLDRFQLHIHSLFEHRLQIGHLDGRAGREAIIQPIEHYNQRHGTAMAIEPALVDAVLEAVQVGKVVLGNSGMGGSSTLLKSPQEMQIETPYLQLVMERLWKEERDRGSQLLRLETFQALGQANQIINAHLNQQMQLLTQPERQIAASIFQHLVTPSGAKYAYSLRDLSDYTELDPASLEQMLEKLCSGTQRILRPVGSATPDKPDTQLYEIFHDALAAPILEWRRRYLEEQEIERKTAALKEKQRQETEHLQSEAEKQQLKAEKLRVEALKQRTQATRQWASALLITSVGALASVGGLWYWSHRNLEIAKLNLNVSQALVQLKTADQLDALELAMQAGQDVKTQLLLDQVPNSMVTLQTILDNIKEQNQWSWQFQGAIASGFGRSPDGQWLAIGSIDGQVSLWNVQKQEWSKFQASDDAITSIDVSAGGQRIVTATTNGQIRIWDATGNRIRELPIGSNSGFFRISLSPDGRKLAVVSRDSGLQVWDVDTGKTSTLPMHNRDLGQIFNVTFSPDNQTLIIADRKATNGKTWITLWNLQSNKSLVTWQVSQGMIFDLRFSPDGKRLATISADGIIHLWGLQGNLITQLKGSRSAFRTVSFSPDGSLLATGAADGTVRVWDLAGNERFELQEHDSEVVATSFSQDGQQLTTLTRQGAVRLWSLGKSERQSTALTVPPRPTLRMQGVAAVAFSPDKQHIAAVSLDGTTYLWQIGKQDSPRKVSSSREMPNFRTRAKVVFSPDGQQLATIAAGTARLQSIGGAAPAKPLFQSKPDEKAIGIYINAEKSRLATATSTGMIHLWDLDGHRLKEFSGQQARISDSAFSPDGQQLATADQAGIVRLWDVQGKLLAELKGHQGPITNIRFSPDGQRLATASFDGTARLWNLQGKELVTISNGNPVISIRFSPVRAESQKGVGQLLATGSFDGMARLWNLNGDKLGEFNSGNALLDTDFSSDGKQLAGGGIGSTVQLWPVKNLDELLQEGCTRMKGYLATHPAVQQELKVCHVR